MEKNLYQILGVSKGASDKEIQKAYRKLARQYHPDLNKNNKGAETKFKEISSAYDVLSEPKRRKLYDEFGEQALQPGFDEEKAEMLRNFGTQFGGGFGGAGRATERFKRSQAGTQFDSADFSQYGNIFEDLFSNFGGARAAKAARGSRPMQQERQVHEQAIDVAFRDAVLGNKIDITVGAGAKNKTLKVSIPPGSRDGSKIRLSGDKTGLGIDLVLSLHLLEDALFSRRGDNLIIECPVKLSEIINGAAVNVPTLDGRVNVRIPPGSQSGTMLRVRGKGVPTKDGAGDLLVKLQLVGPDSNSIEVRELAEKLDRFYTRDPRQDLR